MFGWEIIETCGDFTSSIVERALAHEPLRFQVTNQAHASSAYATGAEKSISDDPVAAPVLSQSVIVACPLCRTLIREPPVSAAIGLPFSPPCEELELRFLSRLSGGEEVD